MKFCKDCKYMTGVAICVHPNNGISLINGGGKPYFCTVNRNSTRYCGPDGNWFEPKEIVVVEEPKPKKWWRIFK